MKCLSAMYVVRLFTQLLLNLISQKDLGHTRLTNTIGWLGRRYMTCPPKMQVQSLSTSGGSTCRATSASVEGVVRSFGGSCLRFPFSSKQSVHFSIQVTKTPVNRTLNQPILRAPLSNCHSEACRPKNLLQFIRKSRFFASLRMTDF